MLERIVYVSAASPLLRADALDQLLGQSRDNNARDGLTGMFIYHDGNILQVLEGKAEKVRATFARIASDTRHKQVLKLWSGPVAERAFEDWSMGFARLEDLSPQLRPHAKALSSLTSISGARQDERVLTALIGSFLRSFRDLASVAPSGH
jgi:hypothetical protein